MLKVCKENEVDNSDDNKEIISDEQYELMLLNACNNFSAEAKAWSNNNQASSVGIDSCNNGGWSVAAPLPDCSNSSLDSLKIAARLDSLKSRAIRAARRCAELEFQLANEAAQAADRAQSAIAFIQLAVGEADKD